MSNNKTNAPQVNITEMHKAIERILFDVRLLERSLNIDLGVIYNTMASISNQVYQIENDLIRSEIERNNKKLEKIERDNNTNAVLGALSSTVDSKLGRSCDTNYKFWKDMFENRSDDNELLEKIYTCFKQGATIDAICEALNFNSTFYYYTYVKPILERNGYDTRRRGFLKHIKTSLASEEDIKFEIKSFDPKDSKQISVEEFEEMLQTEKESKYQEEIDARRSKSLLCPPDTVTDQILNLGTVESEQLRLCQSWCNSYIVHVKNNPIKDEEGNIVPFFQWDYNYRNFIDMGSYGAKDMLIKTKEQMEAGISKLKKINPEFHGFDFNYNTFINSMNRLYSIYGKNLSKIFNISEEEFIWHGFFVLLDGIPEDNENKAIFLDKLPADFPF